ncbi:MAG: valine--tRNA ligase [Planctomycetota bacterium]
MELESRYDPHAHESDVYDQWMAADAFTPSPDKPEGREPFVIMIPPPNVTGVLHMGHALNGTLQDVTIRYQRMRGRDALWLPGTDHAGIATQAVVEKKLYAEEKLTRQELGREAFVEKIWEWKETHGNKILEQYRRLGSSCDWSRTRFTLEPDLSRAVREAFVRLWERDLIYRGARLVNWDCVLQTAVSDDEVEMVKTKSKLHYLKYPVKGEEGRFVTVATTRPETMVGDTGVAVNPTDERYADLVGKQLVLPIVDRDIPVVADDTVDPAFGTGAVKVTPGHDPADYERGARHNLPLINVLNKDGTMNDEAGPFAGMPREKARKALCERLDELGMLDKIEDYVHNVPISDRSKSAIEPLVSEQWFVKMKPLAEPAIAAVHNGALTIRPPRWKKVYLDWLENVHDWCISRQLWWGHRIPVWYDEDGTPYASRDDVEIGSPHPETGKPIVRQDPDVLDTWASSWLWPFATLGWPDQTPDLERFYPTHFLSTAREIIYLWVARMVMAGYALLDHLPEDKRCPFSTCFIHATVLDAKGKRMSKSAGNGIDPLDLIEEFGADAVRLSLVLLTREGQDVKLAPDRIEMGKRFTNKVWNAARFVFSNLEGERTDVTAASATALEDRWILSRLANVTQEVTAALEEYRFNDGATALYRFVWNDFCDWYLELVKSRLGEGDSEGARAARGVLARVLADSLRLLHPFTPFQTEVLWKALHAQLGAEAGLLIRDPWPEADAAAIDSGAEADIGVVQELVGAVRSVRALTMIADRRPLSVQVVAPAEDTRRVLADSHERALALAFLEELDVVASGERPPSSAVSVAGGMEVFVRLGDDVDLDRLRDTLEKRTAKLEKAIQGSEKKLENKGFLERADPDVVQTERDRLGEMRVEIELLARNRAGL